MPEQLTYWFEIGFKRKEDIFFQIHDKQCYSKKNL